MDKRAVVRKFVKGYLSLAAMVVFVLIVSISKGAGWKAILVGMPVFVTFLVGITYQFVKELRALKRKGLDR
jgi:hypothetical protein